MCIKFFIGILLSRFFLLNQILPADLTTEFRNKSLSESTVQILIVCLPVCVFLAADCFELGRQSYNTQDFYHTALWMNEALQRHDMERNGTGTAKWEILEYLAYSKFMQGKRH